MTAPTAHAGYKWGLFLALLVVLVLALLGVPW